MKIVALIDVHPLTETHKRGLSMRIATNGQMFDLPISKEQATLLLSKIGPAPAPEPTPPSPEEMNLFAQFVNESERMDLDEFDEDDDL